MRAALVEVEAYLGLDDPASHAHQGPTPRASIMFGPPGRLYVYLSYGLHHCVNVVCEPEGRAGAVLLRAAAVTQGAGVVLARRLAAPRRGEAAGWRRREGASQAAATGPAARRLAPEALLRGPGNLCRGLGITLADNGAHLGAPGSRVVLLPREGAAPPTTAGPRVGIARAADAPLRFAWAGHAAVSHPRT